MKQIHVATAGADLTGLEGKAVKLDGDGNPIVVTAATDAPNGVIEAGGAEDTNVNIALPGSEGVLVKVSGAVKRLQYGKVAADATFAASAWAQNDVVMVQFLEAGVAGDLVLANILQPVKVA